MLDNFNSNPLAVPISAIQNTSDSIMYLDHILIYPYPLDGQATHRMDKLPAGWTSYPAGWTSYTSDGQATPLDEQATPLDGNDPVA